MTVPLAHYARIDGQDVNIVDESAVHDLFEAVKADDLQSYVRSSGDPVLPGLSEVH